MTRETLTIKVLVISADAMSSAVISRKVVEVCEELNHKGHLPTILKPEVTRIHEVDLNDPLLVRDPDLKPYAQGLLITDNTISVYSPAVGCYPTNIKLGNAAVRDRVRREFWRTRYNPLSASEGETVVRRALRRIIKGGV